MRSLGFLLVLLALALPWRLASGQSYTLQTARATYSDDTPLGLLTDEDGSLHLFVRSSHTETTVRHLRIASNGEGPMATLASRTKEHWSNVRQLDERHAAFSWRPDLTYTSPSNTCKLRLSDSARLCYPIPQNEGLRTG